MRALKNDELRWVAGGYYDTFTPPPEEDIETIIVRGERDEPDPYTWDDFLRDNPDLANPDDGYSGGNDRDDTNSGGSSSTGDDEEDPAIPLDPKQFGIGATFATPEDAMRDALKRLQAESLSKNVEISGIVQHDGNGGYYVDQLWKGDKDGVGAHNYGAAAEVMMSFHTHANFTDENKDGVDDYRSNEFSTQDISEAERHGVDEYMLAPDGTIYKYDVESNMSTTYGNVGDPVAEPIAPIPGN